MPVVCWQIVGFKASMCWNDEALKEEGEEGWPTGSFSLPRYYYKDLFVLSRSPDDERELVFKRFVVTTLSCRHSLTDANISSDQE